MPFYQLFLGEGSPTKIDYRKKSWYGCPWVFWGISTLEGNIRGQHSPGRGCACVQMMSPSEEDIELVESVQKWGRLGFLFETYRSPFWAYVGAGFPVGKQGFTDIIYIYIIIYPSTVGASFSTPPRKMSVCSFGFLLKSQQWGTHNKKTHPLGVAKSFLSVGLFDGRPNMNGSMCLCVWVAVWAGIGKPC